MENLVIPTSPDDPFYVQTSELEGIQYTLTFRYNQREDRWYLTIGDVSGADIVKGIKLVTGTDLLFYFDKPALPPGKLYVISTDGEAPGLGELGVDRKAQLVYVTSV